MSDFNLTSDEKHLLAIMFNQLSREVQPIQETAEDRWEFNQQSEALYQARINKPIDPPFPAVTVPTEQEAPNHNGVVAAPYVNSIFKDDE